MSFTEECQWRDKNPDAFKVQCSYPAVYVKFPVSEHTSRCFRWLRERKPAHLPEAPWNLK